VRRITDDERRSRLGVRHHLARSARGERVDLVAGNIAGLHATDPATLMLSAQARLREPSLEAIEDALYVERSIVRILGMRRTMFVVPVDFAPVVQGACTRGLVPGERKRFIAQLERAGIAADGARWLQDTEQQTLRALRARGEATAAQLAADVPALREKIAVAQDRPYATVQGVSWKVLFLLAAGAQIVRGRPLGSWTSTLYRWAPIESWMPGAFAECETDAAAARLAHRWLAAFGPGTMADLKWWTGWTVGLLKRALAQLDTVEVELDGGEVGLVLAGDEEPVAAVEPWAALLPGLDPAPMGWKSRAWYLGEHRERLFDRSGNIGPTVWWQGQIVGGWAQRKAGGELVVELLEDVGADAAAAIDAEAARLRVWLGDLRVTPRFRTPLERELAG
jgi:hypothetical protein